MEEAQYIDHKEAVRQCLGVHVKYHTRIGRQLSDYYEIRYSLKSVENLSEYYSHKYQEFHRKFLINPDSSRQISDNDILPIKSVFVNIVMTYARCFDTSKSKEGKESRRLIRLSKHFIRNADPLALETHDKLIDLRDKFIAHAGVTELERFEFVIGLDSEGYPIVLPGNDNYRAVAGPDVEIDKIKILVEEIIKEIDRKMNDLLIKAQEELSVFDKKPSALIIRLLNREPVTDEDLK